MHSLHRQEAFALATIIHAPMECPGPAWTHVEPFPAPILPLPQVLAERASDLGVREAGQAVWGLARTKNADKATLDAVVRAVKGKLASAEAGVDVAGLAWGLGYAGYKADADAARVRGGLMACGSYVLSWLLCLWPEVSC